MPAYEGKGFFPPAPVIAARLRGPDSRAVSDMRMLIDTGADVTVLPLQAAYAVGAIAQPSPVPVQFYSGEAVTYLQADLSLEFLRYRFRGLFLLAESEYGVLGRNVLNQLLVTLDGPMLIWSI